MRKLLIGLVFLAPGFALAASDTPSAPEIETAEQTTPVEADDYAKAKTPSRAEARAAEKAARSADPDRMICRQMRETGSRVGGKRVCLTKRQWDLAAEQARRDVEGMQGPAAHDNHHSGASQ
jgi:hypothetical protein